MLQHALLPHPVLPKPHGSPARPGKVLTAPELAKGQSRGWLMIEPSQILTEPRTCHCPTTHHSAHLPLAPCPMTHDSKDFGTCHIPTGAIEGSPRCLFPCHQMGWGASNSCSNGGERMVATTAQVPGAYLQLRYTEHLLAPSPLQVASPTVLEWRCLFPQATSPLSLPWSPLRVCPLLLPPPHHLPHRSSWSF